MTDASSDPARFPPRVLIVDPDERVRESLAGLLAIGHRCTVVGTAGSADVALDLVRVQAPDVVVMDPRLPDLTEGRAFIARLRHVAPSTRIVVMGADLEPAIGDVDAFIRKTYRPRELIEAICTVALSISGQEA